MWLALETSGDLASVAAGRPGHLLAARELAGARRHAGGLLGSVDEVLAAAGASQAEVEGMVLADGPGGFTGLRIGATVAKALLRVRPIPLWVAPALHALAAAHLRQPDEMVVALGDALRGEVYATAVKETQGRLEVVLPPSVFHPADLAQRLERPGRVIIRPEGPRLVPQEWQGIEQVVAAPTASHLLDLVGRAGGVRHVATVDPWEPEYGRPAEAQAKWEATHGRRLPDSPSHLG